MTVKVDVKTNADIVNEAIKDWLKDFLVKAEKAMDMAGKNTAELIRNRYTGAGKGFKDRTGQLRRSIRGTRPEETTDTIEVKVVAGDDRIGSNNLRTREYAPLVEAGIPKNTTPFMLPGSIEAIPIIKKTLIENLK